MLRGGGGVPSPLPARQRPVGAWRSPSSHSGWRSPSTPLADLCGRPRGSPCARGFQTSPAGSPSGSPRPAWGQSSRVAGTGSDGWQSRKPRGPSRRTPSRPRPRPPQKRQKRAQLPFLSETASWNLHPLGFAIFTHPEPSGLHGDASKQQIPGSDDVTFPFPAAQAWRRCRPGLGRASQRPRQTPPARPKAPGPRPAGAGAFVGREQL